MVPVHSVAEPELHGTAHFPWSRSKSRSRSRSRQNFKVWSRSRQNGRLRQHYRYLLIYNKYEYVLTTEDVRVECRQLSEELLISGGQLVGEKRVHTWHHCAMW